MLTDEVIEEGKIFAVLSYLIILSLIAVAFGRRNEYAAFHIKQGLLLFIAEVAAITFGAIPQVGIYILGAVWLALIILSLVGAVNAASGKTWPLPYPLGKLAAEIQL